MGCSPIRESTSTWRPRSGGTSASVPGLEFLEELRAAYTRIITRPLGYQDVGLGTRRALLRRFPYAVYYVIGNDVIVVLAVLHASRDPAEWQRRRHPPDT